MEDPSLKSKLYFENEVLHYIVKQISLRIIWAIVVTVGFTTTAQMIYPMYMKWQDSPTITFPKTTNYPIGEIDFPAVTICSNDKVMNWRLRLAMNNQPWLNLSNDQPYLFEYLRQAIGKIIVPTNDLANKYVIKNGT